MFRRLFLSLPIAFLGALFASNQNPKTDRKECKHRWSEWYAVQFRSFSHNVYDPNYKATVYDPACELGIIHTTRLTLGKYQYPGFRICVDCKKTDSRLLDYELLFAERENGKKIS